MRNRGCWRRWRRQHRSGTTRVSTRGRSETGDGDMKKLLRLSLLAAIVAAPQPALAKPEGAIRHIVSDPRGLAAPGCAVGVFRAGKPVLVTAAGGADIADARAVDGGQMLYAASVSKQFTALAATKIGNAHV